MDLPVPSVFHLERDTSQADWLVAGLKPWGTERVRVWSFVPDLFEAYARVLHPAHRAEENRDTVRWSELAARNGVTVGPTTSFREVSGVDPDEPGWDIASPSEGTLEREQVEAIAEIVAPFTRTPDRCWLAVWEGWGSWGPGSSATLTATLGGTETVRKARGGRRARRSLDRMVRETQRRLDEIPRVTAEHRAYFLFTARLGDISSFEVGGWHQAPSIWWPDDRALARRDRGRRILDLRRRKRGVCRVADRFGADRGARRPARHADGHGGLLTQRARTAGLRAACRPD